MPNAAKFCPDCGAPLGENVRFCPDCGAKMDGGETPQPAVIQPPIPPMAPPPPQAAAQYGPPPPPQGTQYGPLPPGGVDTAAAGFPPVPPPKRGKAGLIVGILGGVVVVAGIVLLILFLTVFNGGGGGGTNEPTALADKYMDSMMKKDVDSYMDCFEKSFFSDSGDYSENMDPRDLVELGLQYVDFKFTGVQLKVQSQTADSAIVVTTAGKASGFASIMDFGTETDLAEEPLEFDMYKKGGRWYLSEDPMDQIDIGDYNMDDYDFEDFDFEDFDL